MTLLAHINKSYDFAILLGGDVKVTDRLLFSIKNCRIIVADGGIIHADKLGVIPEIWVGDFDSTNHNLLEKWSSIKRISYPSDKDLIDGEIAVNQSIKLGAKKIILVGALSGERFDFALQHIMFAISLYKKNLEVLLTSGTEEVFVLKSGKNCFDLPKNSKFSIVALSDVDNLHIIGGLYSISNFSLSLGSSRTISNVVEQNITITIGNGLAVLIARPYDLQRSYNNEYTDTQV
ncbi:thiamine diphosphokinase [Candidatus Liberibacter americanus]|uniref:Thiamine diphosphokinase n=1 Tax=Candidatus Liberibacter americanus str. Sao Paulo TaxID=1261131 RepID=U6B4Q6_9HYPH|nr:thiamine diphosphokinase [Candidatus Liberibacter americanus]AHA28054.1 Thiamine pyrophosphokinase [Candidatus Liberibacter americanus str. Sao Paulo]EMS35976.1 thiamine pyrophosphokinase [Candidatus Liberibacter americanus PW_SP]